MNLLSLTRVGGVDEGGDDDDDDVVVGEGTILQIVTGIVTGMA